MKNNVPILYQIEECPYCHRVRKVLNDSGVKYLAVPVPRDKSQRNELNKVTQQSGVPFFVDEANNFKSGDTDKIVAYIQKMFPPKKEFGSINKTVEEMRFNTLRSLINIDHQLEEC